MEIKEGDIIIVGDTTRSVKVIDGVLCAVSHDHEGAHFSTVAEYVQFAQQCGFDVKIVTDRNYG